MTNQWHPIGTAPKDGTEVFGCILMRVLRVTQEFAVMRFTLDEWWSLGNVVRPTYWMPIPETPELPAWAVEWNAEAERRAERIRAGLPP